MHILYLSYYYSHDLEDARSLLDRYDPMVQWCSAIRRAGADKVSVAQRFRISGQLEKDGVHYYFVPDGYGGKLDWWQNPVSTHQLVVRLQPDIIHCNGWVFPLVWLRPMLSSQTTILWQHHGGTLPPW